MTPQQLKALIDSDSTAAALAAAKNDFACAERCMEITQKVLKPLPLSELGLLALYESDPILGETVLQTIEGVAEQNPIVRRVFKFASEKSNNLPDWGSASIRATLTRPVVENGIGLTEAQAGPILRAAEQTPTITALEVEFARTRI